jgi:hypothetical protein
VGKTAAGLEFEYADDPRAYRAERAAYLNRAREAELLVGLLIASVGGPFVQRKPTRAECRTDQLDYLADKLLAGGHWVRSRWLKPRLDKLGLTVAQIEAWAAQRGDL